MHGGVEGEAHQHFDGRHVADRDDSLARVILEEPVARHDGTVVHGVEVFSTRWRHRRRGEPLFHLLRPLLIYLSEGLPVPFAEGGFGDTGFDVDVQPKCTGDEPGGFARTAQG